MSKDGLCAIVTGSASGLGAATAAILAKGGARIVVNYSSSQKEAEADRRSLPQGGRRSRGRAGRRVARRGLQEDRRRRRPWGRLDALINNAGTTKHVAHDNLDGLSAEDFQRAVRRQHHRPVPDGARGAVAAGSRRQGVGPRVGGGQRLVGRRHQRHRLVGRLCREQGRAEHHDLSLARALAPLIRVNTVCPGYIDTPWFTKGRGEDGAAKVRDAVVAKVPLKVASTAEDIAELVCFLATPASSNMTGEVVRMDAGVHLIT